MFKFKLATLLILILGVFAFSGCDDGGDDGKISKTYAIGDIGPSGAGIVFYINEGGLHGLEVAPEDQSAGAAWSNIDGTSVNGSNTLPDEIGTGYANTNAIITQTDHTASAAKICRDYRGGGKSDWFLPSRNELNAIWDNLVKEGADSNSGVGEFAVDYYWTSSESDYNYAGVQHFEHGYTYDSTKSSSLRVRAVRAF